MAVLSEEDIHAKFAKLVAEEFGEARDHRNPKPYIRVWTKHMELWGVCGDYRSVKFTDKRNAAGSLVLEVPANDYWTAYLYGQHRAAMRPISVDLPGYRTFWLTISFKRVRRGLQKYYEITAIHPIEYLNWIRLWPNPAAPAEVQWPKYFYGVGPAASLCAAGLAANLIRLQSSDLFTGNNKPGARYTDGLLGVVGGALGLAYSAAPTGILGMLVDYKECLWPITVNPRNKLLTDTTTWTAVKWRMDKALDAFLEVCNSNDCQITAQFFIPGEDEQPFPEFYELDRPTLIFDFVDKGAPVGYTGTIVDGLFRTGLKMADDLFEWLSFPILETESYDDYLQHLFGMAPKKPFAVYRTGEYSPLENFEQTTHLPLASRITAGGKSPDWLNDAIVGTANMALQSLGTFVGVSGLNLGPFESQLKDVLFAFHSLEDVRRAVNAGPWRLREAMAENATTGLSLNTLSGMTSQHYKTRDYVSHVITVQNGSPYLVGKHVQIGDPVGVEAPDGKAEVDYLDEITYEDSRKVRGKFTLVVGNMDNEREPGLIALGKIRMLGGVAHSILTGA